MQIFFLQKLFLKIRFPSILGKTHKESTCTFLNVISFLRCIEYRGTFPLIYKSQLTLEHTKVFFLKACLHSFFGLRYIFPSRHVCAKYELTTRETQTLTRLMYICTWKKDFLVYENYTF